jgi:hypothetical protein
VALSTDLCSRTFGYRAQLSVVAFEAIDNALGPFRPNVNRIGPRKLPDRAVIRLDLLFDASRELNPSIVRHAYHFPEQTQGSGAIC